MQSKNKKSIIEQAYKESGNGSEELRVDGSLVKLFEILMQIDQRQKRNGKNN
jgi:hypothetical protein